eukprot:gb/GFBE01063948.1/.p1 GENE.gb/GFBE01063948.1/~~gb/GFBE01063948.1/.p1  ORF type:complete len:155 (+),score=33.32 gb/GFBE01063948.1/:1-465(+)
MLCITRLFVLSLLAGTAASAANAAAKIAKSEADEAEEREADDVSSPDLPFQELAPFGRESVGQELTESAIQESDAMVDQLEKAETAEEKRSAFRALTRLRGVALTSFDGIARSHTGNIDEFTKVNHWREKHPLRHLAEEESDVSKWAFPSNADF